MSLSWVRHTQAQGQSNCMRMWVIQGGLKGCSLQEQEQHQSANASRAHSIPRTGENSACDTVKYQCHEKLVAVSGNSDNHACSGVSSFIICGHYED